MTATKEELAAKIDVTDWFTLRAHLERGAIVVIDKLVDLVEVGAWVANDDVKAIERLISSGLLAKPTVQQVESWDEEKGKRFLCLIVSPYVLIQEQSPANG